jgi:8-hydroxy-5-deazaflavin:NADPH oxidoreductase
MNVGILGSASVAQALAAGFLKHGHQAMLGSRDPNKPDLQAWLKKTPGARVGALAETAKFGELIVLAIKGIAAEHTIDLAGAENFAGKTILDATNPIADAPPVDGVLQFITGPNESLGEKIQAKLPAAHIVKAFNSVGAGQMIDPQYEQGPPTMFYCGNDAGAKKKVEGIIRDFGWEPFDCGTIVAARAIEPLCILWCIPRIQHDQWTHAFKLLIK